MAPASAMQAWMVTTSLICAAAIGGVVVLEAVIGVTAPVAPRAWWFCYALFITTLLLLHRYAPRPHWLSDNALLVCFVKCRVL